MRGWTHGLSCSGESWAREGLHDGPAITILRLCGRLTIVFQTITGPAAVGRFPG